MKINNVNDELPPDRSYVLIHLTNDNWGDPDDKLGNRYWKVAKIIRGLSLKDREKMGKGEIDDPLECGYIFPDGIRTEQKRSNTYHEEDEYGNNKVPYIWSEFGTSSYFGQEVDFWCNLPNIGEL